MRAAIASVNNNSPGPHIISMTGITGTISLLTALPALAVPATIQGPGASTLTVQRSTAGGTPNFAIFSINTNIAVKFAAFTISRGNASSGAGIAIGSGGTATVESCVISASVGPAVNVGNNATLNLDKSTITGTTTASAINITSGGVLNGTSSTISGNTNGAGAGGGVMSSLATVTLTNCTVAGNSASTNGGGIHMSGTGALSLYNCTVAANSAGSVSGFGGGIRIGGGSATLLNTIVAGNSAGTGPDVSNNSNFTSQGHNLIGKTDGSTAASWGATDLKGTIASPLSAQLGALNNNGGPTQTMALQSDSPALNAGDDAVLSAPYSLTYDQRGNGYPRQYGLHVDIGAFERNLNDAALPVELTDFALASGDQQVFISWRTGSEVRNAGFEVQRALASDPTFVALTSYLTDPTLVGLGTSARGRDYSVTDAEVEPGTAYLYRLVDVSTEGVRTVHDAKLIETAPLAGTHLMLSRIAPNPSLDRVKIGYSIPEAAAVTMKLMSLDGKGVRTVFDGRELAAGSHEETIDVSGLAPGFYLVTVTAGRQSRTGNIVVVR